MTAAGIKPVEVSPDSSVLVVLLGSIGDVARGLAIAAPIKAAFPRVRLTWLVEPKSEDLVRRHPGIDEVLVFQRSRGLRAVAELKRELARRHFDITLDLQRHFKSGLFSFLSGARVRIGFHSRNAKEFNWLFNNRQIPFYPDSTPKVVHYLHFLAELGIAIPEELDFGLPRACLSPGCRRVAVVLSSSWPSKDWPLEGYDKLVGRLLGARPEIEVTLAGDRARIADAGRLCEKYPEGRLINRVGKTSLAELVDELRGCAVAVGPDSGPGHLAAALGVPYVSLFGPTSPERTAPYRSEALVLRSGIACSPCYRKRCPGLGTLCMRLIDPDQVMEKVLFVLDAPGARREQLDHEPCSR